MKLFLRFTTPLLLAGAIYISIPKKNNASVAGDPMEEDANERLAWELRRLADSTGKIPDNIREKELAFAATLPNDFSLTATNRSLQQTTWNPRGPWNVGGRTRAFAIDKLNENHLIAGSTSGGIWSSLDGGVSWTKVTPLTNYHGITCLVQDVRVGHESTWYAGSGEPYGQSASGGSAYFLGNGVLKSTDNGQTWSPLAPTTTNTPQSFDSFWDMNWNMATDRFDMNNDVIYTACLGAIYKSVNGGTNWTTIRGGNTNAYSYFTDIATTDSGIVYATLSSDGPQRGIWRSVDQGTNWTKISTSLFGDSLCNRVVMGINPQNNNEIYFLGNTEGLGMPDTNFQGDVEYNVLWRYTYLGGDGSGSNGVWEDLSMNLPTGQQQGLFSDFNAQGSYDLVVAVKPDDSNVVFIAGTNIYRSSSRFNDNTNTTYMGGYAPFTNFPYIDSYTNHHPDNHVFAFLPSNADVLFNANDGGVFKTMDCMDSNVSWTSLNNGYFTTQFYTVALDHGTPGSAIIAAGAQDNGTWWTNTTTLTTPWTHPRGGDGSYVQIEDGAGMYYFSIQKGKMNKATLDANGNPTAARRIDPIGGEDYQFINPFALDPNNQNIMYLAGGKYLWRNSDLSQIPLDNQWDSITTNWTRWNDSIPALNSFMTAVTVCKTPANRVYYGTDKKRVYRVDNAHTGTPTPVDISASTFPATGFVSCVATNPNNGDDLIVSFSNYNVYSLFHSTDAGATWTKIAGNLEQNANGSGNGPSIRWVSYLPVSDGMVYLVSTSTGLYATDTLNGLNTIWVRQGETSIGAVVCDMTDVRVSDGTVIVGTHANGIYSATITSVNDIVTVRPVEQAELFAMNLFPNPTSDEVTLSLNLAKDGEVVVSVLDELGRLIRSERKRYVAGEIRHGLNVRDLTAGVYYVRVETSAGAQTKTLMIAR